jgi:hypothetical protein
VSKDCTLQALHQPIKLTTIVEELNMLGVPYFRELGVEVH